MMRIAGRVRARAGVLGLCAIAACNGDCSNNAVVVATEITRIAPVIDTIEVYEDSNGDLDYDISERTFVVAAFPGRRKSFKITFLPPGVPRGPLVLPPPCQATPCPKSFLDFSSIVDPFPRPWAQAIEFDDGTDNTTGTTTSVTYRLHDDLRYRHPWDPAFDFAIPVTVKMNLDMLDPTLEQATFFFMIGKQVSLNDPDINVPPRVVAVTPSPPLPTVGWNRQITSSDFLPGEALEDLDQLLARVDAQVVGEVVGHRVAPHGGLELKFDDPMVNLVVQVSPAPDTFANNSDAK